MKLEGNQLQQTAVIADRAGALPGADTSNTPARPQLHYSRSIEDLALIFGAVRGERDRCILSSLTEREFDILLCLGMGFRDKKIAKRLNIAVSTARTNVRDLIKRTGANRLRLAGMGYVLLGAFEQDQRAAKRAA